MLARICQSQVDQLAARLPLRAAWIVYQNQDFCRRRVVATANAGEAGSNGHTYLESEAWIQHRQWPAGRLLPLPEQRIASAYALVLGPNRDRQAHSGPDYLLLWCRQPLTPEQQDWIQHEANLVAHLLQLNRRYCRQQTEIELLEQLVHQVGHQISNPLAIIRLSAETLHHDLPQTIYQEQVSLICMTAERLKVHLNHLIQCGRRSSLNIAPHNLQEILAESLQELRPCFDQQQIQVQVATSYVDVAVDRIQLRQVFDNLLGNAIAFSPAGSTVTCRWQVFAQEVLVQVVDQGPGLSDEDLQRAFVPFYSRRPGGKGLGLAIAKKIILDHQGRLWAENIPGGGAQFSFTLPRADEQPVAHP